jgi:hypothetical protein
MTAGRPAPTPTDHHTRRIRVVDWVLVPLAWGSAGLAIWWLFWEPTGLLRERLRLVDLGISAVFAVTICWRWLRFRTGWRYLRKHWWEVIALVPFAVLGGWSFLGYAVLAARLVRLVDRTDNVFGDRITEWLIRHFSEPIVDAIKRPITIAVLDEVIDVIKTGHYAANVSAALEENRLELESLILDLIRQDQAAGKLRRVPFHDDVVRLVSDTVFRIVHGALDDPRVHELIDDVIRNSATQLRQSVRLGVHD